MALRHFMNRTFEFEPTHIGLCSVNTRAPDSFLNVTFDRTQRKISLLDL